MRRATRNRVGHLRAHGLFHRPLLSPLSFRPGPVQHEPLRLDRHRYASPRAVQCHPHEGQSGFVWLSARTEGPHHGGASYVWCLTARRNQGKHPPNQNVYRSFFFFRAQASCTSSAWTSTASTAPSSRGSKRTSSPSTSVRDTGRSIPSPMGVDSVSSGFPHARPTGVHRTCGEPGEIPREKPPPEKYHHPFMWPGCDTVPWMTHYSILP